MVRVAVTSSIERSSGMAAELVAHGLEPVIVPCTVARSGSIDDIVRMRGACEDADLIVLDSVRPLEMLWRNGPVPATPMAVTSESIAAAVGQRGGTVATIGNGRGLDLAEELCSTVEGMTVAFPHAVDTDPRSILMLADGAHLLIAAPVYANHPHGPPLTHVDAAVFLSGLAVHGWAMTRSFTGMTVAAQGIATRYALAGYDRQADVVSDETRYSDLAARLAHHLA